MKDWFKKHYVGLGACVLAGIALCAAVKGCDGNEAANDRIDGIEANVDSLANNQQQVIELINNHETRIRNNATEINNLKNRMSAAESDISDLQDSIAVHREEIDSLRHDVDSIFKRQEKCPCINPTVQNPGRQNPVRQNPGRQNSAPVRRDTVVVVVKQDPAPVAAPVQDARGCGDDQNANVVIRGDNNTVNISNNGNNGAVAHSDTTRTVTRRVSANCSSTLVVNTVVTRSSYCR